MDYVDELTSGRTPLVKKAANKILKGKLKGYGPFLHQALEGEMEKPKSWESQMYLLYAMAATDCTEEVPYLKSLLLRDIPTPVTYRSLAVAIAYLENLETENLSFVYESLESNNSLQAAGACAALYMRKIVLKDDDFEKIHDLYHQGCLFGKYKRNNRSFYVHFGCILSISRTESPENCRLFSSI